MTPAIDTPDDFSAADPQRFDGLVIKGGEVGDGVLTDNIARATILAVYRENSLIIGVTHPQGGLLAGVRRIIGFSMLSMRKW